ncbi:MAG TPA: cytidine deaminase [Mycobacteriales bacterium]|nr:cytidine deaminase [Mycobacteriales bacterium]
MDAEDEKLVTLARSALPRARGAQEGAAVRDDMGRTYAGASVEVADLQLTALEVAVAMAVSSGVRRLERAVVVTTDMREATEQESGVLDALGSPPLTVLAGGTS